jgi:hypothetical protein
MDELERVPVRNVGPGLEPHGLRGVANLEPHGFSACNNRNGAAPGVASSRDHGLVGSGVHHPGRRRMPPLPDDGPGDRRARTAKGAAARGRALRRARVGLQGRGARPGRVLHRVRGLQEGALRVRGVSPLRRGGWRRESPRGCGRRPAREGLRRLRRRPPHSDGLRARARRLRRQTLEQTPRAGRARGARLSRRPHRVQDMPRSHRASRALPSLWRPGLLKSRSRRVPTPRQPPFTDACVPSCRRGFATSAAVRLACGERR